MRATTILQSDLPNMASHCAQSECGFSIYRGVIVQWDEDHDERVLDVLDQMPAHILDSLFVVQEHEGAIAFVWKGDVPKGYEEGTDGVEPGDGDLWCIISSFFLPNKQ
jgi:hypothetical protein